MSMRPGWSKWDGVAPDVIAGYRAGLPLTQISAANGIPRGSIYALLDRHGVARDRRPRQPLPALEIVRLYVGRRASIREIAAGLGTSFNAVRAVLVGAGVHLRPSGAPRGKDRR
ncbi:hypothetical protein [Kitasatospora sp. MAP5-34]|uniref:helix-turn-helix domain-containing protein n=1 Tax=Kitasatospora sp. MAP5-34 TaxID=3035102 RepID=UPI002473B754|nr:hypothetical protein [Kitasatospora sp. MAP5-34]MDH6579827.1 hypothetical protein [Kitasatospora sp. MAP5-34]